MINTDGQILITLGIGVLLLAMVTEMAARRGWLPQWLARKLLHIGAIGACALAPMWLADLTVLRWVVAVTEILLVYLVATGRLFRAADGRRSWGIAWFPLTYLLLLLFVQNRFLIVVPMAILAVSDAAAAIVGQLFARRFFQLTGDNKSLPGSLAFLTSTLLVIWASQYVFPQQWGNAHTLPSGWVSFGPDQPWLWATIGFVALLLTALEALGSRGFDNLFIPLAAAVLLERCLQASEITKILQLWIAVGTALGFIWFTVRRKSLTLDGAVMAAVVGLWVLYFTGLAMLWPLLFFFVTSTLIGRLTKRRRTLSDTKHGQARDYRQVLCNGGVYAQLAPVAFGRPDIPVMVLMVVSLAVSTADTWASEIGIYYRGRTYDLWRWRPTPVGLSGGVSWAGTLGGLAGSAALSVVGLLSFSWSLDLLPVLCFTAAGCAGMLLDSLLGATLQVRYRNEQTGELTDLPTNILHSGYPWMSNDAVNLLSNIVTVLAVWVCFLVWLLFRNSS